MTQRFSHFILKSALQSVIQFQIFQIGCQSNKTQNSVKLEKKDFFVIILTDKKNTFTYGAIRIAYICKITENILYVL